MLREKVLRIGKKFHVKSMVLKSGLFDEQYYLAQNPAISTTRLSPIDHFLRHGGKEGRNPHPDFDSEYYLHANPDIKASGMNPLVHYLLYGKDEGRMPVGTFEIFQHLSDEEWLHLLIRSINETRINGVTFPRFPDEKLQSLMVGSANEHSLLEAFKFYKLIKKYAQSKQIPFDKTTRMLDFGCGWGRHYRFFMKDLRPENIVGIDSDPNFIKLCRTLNPAGTFKEIAPYPPTDLEDGVFDIIYAYSVFSHLNEPIGLAWISEFARLLKPDGLVIVTTHSRSFIEICESFRHHPETQTCLWHQILASKAFVDIQQTYMLYDRGDFLYAATGGGVERPADIYGEAVLSKEYIKRKWSHHFEFIDFVDNSSILPQAFVVLRKKQLPEFILESNDKKINMTISSKDEMYNYIKTRMPDEVSTRKYYFDTGRELSVNLVDFLLQEGLFPKCLDILDFAAGYGRVTRWLVALFKSVSIADMEQDMIDFHRSEYDIGGFVVENDPKTIQQLVNYDIVFVFSLFTHLPAHTWLLWLRALSNMVRQNGFLVFSTHSYELFAELNPKQFGDPATWNDEFLFWETNETNGRLETSVYGCTIVMDSYVRQAVAELTGFRFVRHFRKSEFDRYHDIYIIQKV